ncbi:hypothetical protein GCM10016455_21310 [Aliiroseovarius zhejiangensis]|uniref:Uncharacterized protein n=1 Tax=Aliiroseovarius zhejiangensis TaxID=1632025 RepID=A0ABQ3J5S1_9RHOB|nr:hypothetical protein GCM10016455_21310 [Aliiroseovarius zhejiangensis]
MRFSSQQTVLVLVSITVIWADLVFVSGPLVEWNTSRSVERLYLFEVGLIGLLVVVNRWIVRTIWFAYRDAPWMKRYVGALPNAFRDSWYARHNRWFLHVDEQGNDRDLDAQ